MALEGHGRRAGDLARELLHFRRAIGHHVLRKATGFEMAPELTTPIAKVGAHVRRKEFGWKVEGVGQPHDFDGAASFLGGLRLFRLQLLRYRPLPLLPLATPDVLRLREVEESGLLDPNVLLQEVPTTLVQLFEELLLLRVTASVERRLGGVAPVLERPSKGGPRVQKHWISRLRRQHNPKRVVDGGPRRTRGSPLRLCGQELQEILHVNAKGDPAIGDHVDLRGDVVWTSALEMQKHHRNLVAPGERLQCTAPFNTRELEKKEAWAIPQSDGLDAVKVDLPTCLARGRLVQKGAEAVACAPLVPGFANLVRAAGDDAAEPVFMRFGLLEELAQSGAVLGGVALQTRVPHLREDADDEGEAGAAG
eukprot:scaffold1409_cov245-Pinguiococcus_pyrenoidosus.AAC.6